MRFLESVAKAYINNEAHRLVDFCFVFPSKRSALFFTEAMRKQAIAAGLRSVLMPKTQTIVEFMDSFCPTVKADRTEEIFILFDCYRRVVAKHKGQATADGLSFTRFVQWAETALNDFDDVDRALADPQQVFGNVARLRDIASNYLTEKQLEVISKYWNIEGIIDGDVVKDPNAPLWRTPTEAAKRFVRLWQVLAEVYALFVEAMAERGLHSAGMAFRRAAETVADTHPDDFPCTRYIFVGFNLLSGAEIAIFNRLQQKVSSATGESMADFYWDFASPVFRHPQAPKGLTAFMKYQKDYPSRYQCVDPVDTFPQVNIFGIPSRVGQAKFSAGILAQLYPADKAVEPRALLRTSIVLPEERLLTPLVSAAPRSVGALNITMGFKLRNTSVASLIRDVVAMQMRATHSQERNVFFFEDVMTVLSNPLVHAVYSAQSIEMLTEMQKTRIYNVPEAYFSNTPFAPLFKMVVLKEDVNAVFDYLEGVLRWVFAAVEAKYGKPTAPVADDGDHDVVSDIKLYLSGWRTPEGKSTVPPDVLLQCAFLVRYAVALANLRGLMLRYLGDHPATVDNLTVINMVERIMNLETVSFNGEPLRGIPVMGVLEARALDFDTLIVPSMNDGVFPPASRSISFIPNAIRRAFGLFTRQDEENNYTYFFYRMISRARQVYLLYDARSTGAKKRPPSRYLRQLQYIYRPENLRTEVLSYSVESGHNETPEVAKTPEILSEIEKYFTPESGKALSASAIKQYLKCPMAFYLERICKYKREDDVTQWMDEATYGTIMHGIFERIYNDMKGDKAEGVEVTAEMLDNVIRRPVYLDRIIADCIKENYLRLKPGDARYNRPLYGDALIYARTIKTYVEKILAREKEIAPFWYQQSEFAINSQYVELSTADGKHLGFNFRGYIDRIDRISLPDQSGRTRLRIVDYKTGADKTEFTGTEQIFTDHAHQAIVQVMLYCIAYAQANKLGDEPIQPMIYPMHKLATTPIAPLRWGKPNADVADLELKEPRTKNGKWAIWDYRDYLDVVSRGLIDRLSTMRNPDVPFTCTTDVKGCKRCAFAPICQRNHAD